MNVKLKDNTISIDMSCCAFKDLLAAIDYGREYISENGYNEQAKHYDWMLKELTPQDVRRKLREMIVNDSSIGKYLTLDDEPTTPPPPAPAMQNGIVINGKQYELAFANSSGPSDCEQCALYDQCDKTLDECGILCGALFGMPDEDFAFFKAVEPADSKPSSPNT